MSTKLKDLKVTQVDFVDAGANPKADIMLHKSKGGKTKEENGSSFPAAAYAYVPDPNEPSTWKLRLWEDPDKKVTAKQVGMAVAALGAGFRGNKAEIPADDLPKVKEKILSAWKQANPDAKDDDVPDALKKETTQKGLAKRLLSAIEKALGIDSDDNDASEVKKDKEIQTFAEALKERQMRQVSDQIWDTTYALQESLTSILLDDTVAADQKATLMAQSLEEFTAAAKSLISSWATGQTAGAVTISLKPAMPAQLEIAKSAKARLEQIIAKADPGSGPAPEPGGAEPTQTMKGVLDDMKIDKSKLTPEQQAQLDAIEKAAGIPEDEPPAGNTVTKSADGKTAQDEDIYKGLHPAVAAELQELRKRADAAEDRELQEVAKKYEIIGKKPEELAPVLKSLKASGNGAYEQMISVLDAAVETVNKSGIFKELGKSGGEGGGADAWTQIEKHAEEIMKSAPTMSRTAAIDKACEQHPELVADYEAKRSN